MRRFDILGLAVAAALYAGTAHAEDLTGTLKSIKDSGAITTAPAGAVNQGPIDEKSWKYGHAFDHAPNAKIWNPVKLKLMRARDRVHGRIRVGHPELLSRED